jgi:two-component system NtrC family sensor kinase
MSDKNNTRSDAKNAAVGAAVPDQYFRLIAENLTDMVALVDTTGRRLYCTPNYSFLGDPAKLQGTNSFEAVHPEDAERIKGIFFDTVRTGNGQSTQYRLVLKDGSVRHIQSQGIAIKSPEGKVEKVLIVSRDVTETLNAANKQKALELQLVQADKLNALGQIVSGVAHELNNPLTGIMGYCQLLLRDNDIQDNTRHREDVTTIFHEAERCQKIVRNLTTFARQHKPEKTFLGINGLLEDSLNLQEYHLRLHNIAVVKELDGTLPRTMADRHQLQQVFINLVGNAQDAMSGQKEEKRLLIRTLRTGDLIRVEISDSGPGIPRKNLTTIFEPFFTTKDPGKGTGLGLSISFGIISEHGGKIWAENMPERGARFCLELPIVAEPAVQEGKGGRAGCPPLKSQRVLIIDDEESIIDLSVRTLRLLGLSPDTARDPVAAKKKLEAGTYDAVFCDYRLPGLSGLELYKWAVALRPGLEKRWVFVTGSSGGEDLYATGRPVLQKPFTLEALQEMLCAVLRQ